MTYRTLSPSLYSTADAAQEFFKDRLGLKFVIEQPLQPDLPVITTLHAVTKDFHYLCVDVSESSYTDTLDAFVLECKNRILPVRLYVAVPKGISDAKFKANFQRAGANGVGIVELDAAGEGTVLREPLSLSLTGVRPIDFKTFPAKYRPALHTAYETFQHGNPAKGCSMIYDEIEGLTRSIARKADSRKCWSSAKHVGSIDLKKAAWSSVVDHLMKHLDPAAAKTPDLRKPLFSRVLGLTDHRNDAGHKPTVKALIQRDKQLRTRFEHATDILAELVEASKPLRP